MYAKTIIIGRVGSDPETKQISGDKTMTRVNVAADHNYKKDNEWVTDTEWYRVTFFGWAAPSVAEWKKGDVVFIEGRMHTRSWEDKDGNKKYSTELLPTKQRRVSANVQSDGVPNFDENDEIPF